MGLECELKYLDVDLDDLSRRLGETDGRSSGRYFESNLVFDYPDRSLKEAGILLRLRDKQGRAVLTVKRPPEVNPPSALKVFEEIESEVEDFDTVRKALEVVGFQVAFAYEKVREKWTFMECTVCLDRLPFGDFVEIEGTEESVPACAGALDLRNNLTSTETYHALNIEYRKKHGLSHDESFIFSSDQKSEIIREIRKD